MTARWAEEDRPVSLLIDQDMPDGCQDAIEEAVSFWYAHGVHYLYASYVRHGHVAVQGLPRKGEIAVTAAALSPGRLGETTLEWKRGEIVSAHITLAFCGDGVAANVASHEVGHALGLQHDSAFRNLMYPYSDGSGWQITPEQEEWVE